MRPAHPVCGQTLRQLFGINQHFDAARCPWLPSDEARPFQRQHHLVNRWRADAKIFLHVGFGWRAAVEARVEVDIGQVLALLGREGLSCATHRGLRPFSCSHRQPETRHRDQIIRRASPRTGSAKSVRNPRAKPDVMHALQRAAVFEREIRDCDWQFVANIVGILP
jgi:hypothetical protein